MKHSEKCTPGDTWKHIGRPKGQETWLNSLRKSDETIQRKNRYYKNLSETSHDILNIPKLKTDQKQKFGCPDCEFYSSVPKKVHDHIEFTHKGMRLQCPLCETNFASHQTYDKHNCRGEYLKT